MYEEPEIPLRELAQTEPLMERARLMTDAPGPAAPNGIRMVRVAVNNATNTATLDVHFYNTNYLPGIINTYNANNNLAKTIFPISGGTRQRAGSAAGQVQVVSTPAPPAAITRPEPTVIRLIVKPI